MEYKKEDLESTQKWISKLVKERDSFRLMCFIQGDTFTYEERVWIADNWAELSLSREIISTVTRRK